RFEEAINKDPKLAQFKNQIKLELTPEGLQVSVVDEQNRAMFDTGKAVLKSYTVDIMHAIGGLLNGVDNAISLAGHTDANQYAGGERGYSNWELSVDRANASRRELVAGGMNESKVIRVVGLGSSVPLDRNDPLNAMNRRISLVVLNEKTERQIRGLPEEPDAEVQDAADAARILGASNEAQGAPADNASPQGAPARDGAPPEAVPEVERLAQPNGPAAAGPL
ncbi:MAG TPA: OmpA family protein, partial [Gammaproteobacteria bacterium]|nr:OmpA family protein [Gammaproteobacteria bacterium]